MDQLMANRRAVEANLHKIIQVHCLHQDHDVLLKLVGKMNKMSKIEQAKRPKQVLQRASVVKVSLFVVIRRLINFCTQKR